MPLSVIVLDFDPILRAGDRGVRLETVALGVALLAALLLAGLAAGRTPADAGRPSVRLRRDDLLLIVLGVVPGAVLGGRLGYLLLHLEYYRAHPWLVADPAQGALQLSLAVVTGTLTGAYVARLLDTPVGRWLHVATVPLLVALGLGKVATALGGDGQGLPSDLPWSTAYAGPGPWGSLGPAIASHPAQLYEAAATGVVLVVVLSALFLGGFERRDGRLFLVALALWAAGRFAVAFTWRDPAIVGPLRADQLLSIAIVAGCLVLLPLARRAGLREGRVPEGEPPGSELRWPDPETRPRF